VIQREPGTKHDRPGWMDVLAQQKRDGRNEPKKGRDTTTTTTVDLFKATANYRIRLLDFGFCRAMGDDNDDATFFRSFIHS
jgi:hypothetical protein